MKIAASRDLSTAIFGARYRLEICAALAGKSTVTATELLYELGAMADPPSQASVSVELKRLSSAGLLTPITPAPGDRHRRLAVAESPIWKAAAQLVMDAQEGLAE